ncbi:sugar dehydrogenase complex small subunit [Enhygromyxa salina]|uniref:Membrane bound FAD containing D-sorbitol dehydrogenase n=1 Tax=Enhygromyxa salina TaxID=215803 RepID=A0A2S9YXE6_9BACT|nr:sugar dehydrogenase complex small subunit [Enhygromyxa salina]PRQ09761.1 Membrane bound FAD containing D-sorbitol dehydrogenase [Enhygromyxa salina]
MAAAPHFEAPESSLARRRFVAGVSNLAILSLMPISACREQDEDRGYSASERFYLLSVLLTGFDDLDEALAELYLSSIEADPDHSAALARLYEAAGFYTDPPSSFAQLEAAGVFEREVEATIADSITMIWYSGVYIAADSGEPLVATHLEALSWRALSYTRPPSVCGGALGYWALAPGI